MRHIDLDQSNLVFRNDYKMWLHFYVHDDK